MKWILSIWNDVWNDWWNGMKCIFSLWNGMKCNEMVWNAGHLLRMTDNHASYTPMDVEKPWAEDPSPDVSGKKKNKVHQPRLCLDVPRRRQRCLRRIDLAASISIPWCGCCCWWTLLKDFSRRATARREKQQFCCLDPSFWPPSPTPSWFLHGIPSGTWRTSLLPILGSGSNSITTDNGQWVMSTKGSLMPSNPFTESSLMLWAWPAYANLAAWCIAWTLPSCLAMQTLRLCLSMMIKYLTLCQVEPRDS